MVQFFASQYGTGDVDRLKRISFTDCWHWNEMNEGAMILSAFDN